MVQVEAVLHQCRLLGALAILPIGWPWGAGAWLMGGGGGCSQGGGIPLGLGGIGGPPMFGMGGGKLWGAPPWPLGMPW